MAALISTHRAIRSMSERASRSSPVRKWYLAISPSPERRSRGGSVARASVSQITPIGCQNAPTRFLPSGRLTPVLPPMAASTIASSDVATCTTATPRCHTAAANPATSVTSPPPTATTTSSRVSPTPANARARCSTVTSDLLVLTGADVDPHEVCGLPSKALTASPNGIVAWVTTATRCAPWREQIGKAGDRPGADVDVVTALPQRHVDRAHLAHHITARSPGTLRRCGRTRRRSPRRTCAALRRRGRGRPSSRRRLPSPAPRSRRCAP